MGEDQTYALFIVRLSTSQYVKPEELSLELFRGTISSRPIATVDVCTNSIGRFDYDRQLASTIRATCQWGIERGSLVEMVKCHMKLGQPVTCFYLRPSCHHHFRGGKSLLNRTLWEENRHALKCWDTGNGQVKPVAPG